MSDGGEVFDDADDAVEAQRADHEEQQQRVVSALGECIECGVPMETVRLLAVATGCDVKFIY